MNIGKFLCKLGIHKWKLEKAMLWECRQTGKLSRTHFVYCKRCNKDHEITLSV